MTKCEFLKISCTIQITEKEAPLLENFSQNVSKQIAKKRKRSLADDLEDWRLKKQKSDFNLVSSDGKFIPCFSLVLQSRSDVFETYLNHDTEERRTGKIILNDTEGKIVEAFIKFLNTDRLEANMAEDLLVLAEKYNVQGLKISCQQSLHSQINRFNVIRLAIKADLFGADHLKSSCIEWIKEDKAEKDYFKSDQFEQLKQENPKLAFKLLGHWLEKNDLVTIL